MLSLMLCVELALAVADSLTVAVGAKVSDAVSDCETLWLALIVPLAEVDCEALSVTVGVGANEAVSV